MRTSSGSGVQACFPDYLVLCWLKYIKDGLAVWFLRSATKLPGQLASRHTVGHQCDRSLPRPGYIA